MKLAERFLDESRPAFDAWLALRPLRNPDARHAIPDGRVRAAEQAEHIPGVPTTPMRQHATRRTRGLLWEPPQTVRR